MADSFSDIMGNYENKSLEELGSSLLSRQEQINKENAKEAKKSQKIGQALALIGVGQQVFKASYKRREKELDDLKIFEIQNNTEQTQKINAMGNILQAFPDNYEVDKSLDERVALYMESPNADILEQKLKTSLDSAIEQGNIFDEYSTLVGNKTLYNGVKKTALENVARYYLDGNKYKEFDKELGQLYGDLDRQDLLSKAMNLTPHELTKTERIYFDNLKKKYQNVGVIDGIKQAFRKLGKTQEEAGHINLFKKIDENTIYGDMDSVLSNLSLRGVITTSVQESMVTVKNNSKRYILEANEDTELQETTSVFLNQFDINQNQRAQYNKTDAMGEIYRMTGKRGRFETFYDDVKENTVEIGQLTRDVAAVDKLLADNVELAENIYTFNLEKINEKVTENKLMLFRKNILDDSYRLNFSIMTVANEGFKTTSMALGNRGKEHYDGTGIIGNIQKIYSYDRFSGMVPSLINDGIMSPSETKEGFETDENWEQMDEQSQREVFDVHFNNINNSKLNEGNKNALFENLFDKVANPDNFNFEEYVLSKNNKEFVPSTTGIPMTRTLNPRAAVAKDRKLKDEEKSDEFLTSIKNSKNPIIQRLYKDEGYRTNVYEDSEGFLTYGMGHKLTDKEKEIYKKGDYVPADVIKKVTTKQVEEFINLTNEAMKEEGLLNSKLYEDNKDMFVSFFYQLGKDGGLAFDDMWEAINKGDAQGAYDAALDSLWAKQTPQRAKRFAKMLLENV